jgi:hypothetical protein
MVEQVEVVPAVHGPCKHVLFDKIKPGSQVLAVQRPQLPDELQVCEPLPFGHIQLCVAAGRHSVATQVPLTSL